MTQELADLILDTKLLSPEVLDRACDHAKDTRVPLSAALVELGLLTDDTVSRLVSEAHRAAWVDLDQAEVDPTVLKLVPAAMARKLRAVPLARRGATLTVAFSDPSDESARDEIHFSTGYLIDAVTGSASAIERLIALSYPLDADETAMAAEPPSAPPISLHALLLHPETVSQLSHAELLGRLSAGEAITAAELPSPSAVAAALETVRIQLEDDDPGRRFPLVWRLARALIQERAFAWVGDDLDAVLQEVELISRELEPLPIQRSAVVALDEDGFPGVFAREAPRFVPSQGEEELYKNLLVHHGPVLRAVAQACREAKSRAMAVGLVRQGAAVQMLWGA